MIQKKYNKFAQNSPFWMWVIFVLSILVAVYSFWVITEIQITLNTSKAAVCQNPLQSCVDTTMPNQTGATINVPAGGNLQAAIDSANFGDTIVLQAGATYTGPVVLKNKSGSGWVVIRSSRASELPAPGNRVGPQHASLMAKIVSPGGNQTALMTAPSAHHYRIIGIEFAKVSPSVTETNLIALGDFNPTSLSTIANNLVLDRVYAHGDSTSYLRRCVALNSSHTAIIDSYISNCTDNGADSQAIGGWNGPGPFKIVNNYLEAAGENVMFGGADPSIPNLITSDVEFRHNYVYKPLSWKFNHPTYDQRWRVVKNSFELKNAQRVLLEGNIFEHNWGGQGQSGSTIVFTPRNQNGTCTWCVVRDVVFRYNIIRNVDIGINILGTDDLAVSQQTARVTIQNNLMTNLVRGFQSNGVRDLTIDHNTIFNSYSVYQAYGLTHQNFVFTNNIYSSADYGFNGDDSSEGVPALNKYFPGYVFLKNIATGRYSGAYPAGNFFPSSFANVGFVNYAGGDYSLASSSPYKNAGTDGKDPGVDFVTLQSMTANVVTGTWGATPPPVVPPPQPPPPPPPPPSGAATSIAPTSLNFGSVNVGLTSSSQMVSVTNLGSTSVSIGSANISGDYKIIQNFCTQGIQPGTHCDVYVAFSPISGGSRTGQLTLTETSGKVHTVSLSGTGLSALLGDLNNDGIVNTVDWSMMNSKWLTSDPVADINKDGLVNTLDWSIMNSNWLKTN